MCSSCLICLSPKHSDSKRKAISKEMDVVWNSKSSSAEKRERTRQDIHHNMTKKPVNKGATNTAFSSDLVLDNSDSEVDAMPDFNSESETSDVIVTDNPFDPKYELWEVIDHRAKVRIQEHRRSKKICELTRGTVVRCVKRSSGKKRFKIDLPVVGWCSFVHSARVFDRVDPSTLSILDNRFVLELKVGQGSFGKVFVAWDRMRTKRVALKIDQPKGGKKSVFNREIAIMKVVTECKSVPSLLYCGSVMTHTKNGKDCHKENSYEGLQYMIMDLQGLSLSILKKNYLNLFSLKTVLMLGIVIVKILREVHDVGVLHRDIKPANFVVSRANSGRNIFILDFGLSVMYRRDDGSHVEYQEGSRRCGTARYSSINTHKRIRQSRRDDLEAFGYVLLLFLRDLPWKQKKGESPEKKWKRILVEKMRWTPTELCAGLAPSIGDMFCAYFDYCRNLNFSSKPNYNKLVTLFTKTLEQNNEKLDYEYDWCKYL